jgi:prolyl-tRNA synthetase
MGNAYAIVFAYAEFLWQEGHTAHSTADEAVKETLQMLDVYAEFAERTWRCRNERKKIGRREISQERLIPIALKD